VAAATATPAAQNVGARTMHAAGGAKSAAAIGGRIEAAGGNARRRVAGESGAAAPSVWTTGAGSQTGGTTARVAAATAVEVCGTRAPGETAGGATTGRGVAGRASAEAGRMATIVGAHALGRHACVLKHCFFLRRALFIRLGCRVPNMKCDPAQGRGREPDRQRTDRNREDYDRDREARGGRERDRERDSRRIEGSQPPSAEREQEQTQTRRQRRSSRYDADGKLIEESSSGEQSRGTKRGRDSNGMDSAPPSKESKGSVLSRLGSKKGETKEQKSGVLDRLGAKAPPPPLSKQEQDAEEKEVGATFPRSNVAPLAPRAKVLNSRLL
jgi:hypothetical protein